MTSLLVSNDFPWQIIFYFQGVLIVPCFVFSMFTPERYFDIDQAVEIKRLQEKQQMHGTFRGLMLDEKIINQEWNVFQTFGLPAVLLAGKLEHRMKKRFYAMNHKITEQDQLQLELLENSQPS